MKQTDLSLNLTTERTHNQPFLATMEGMLLGASMVKLVAPCAPEGKNGRPPVTVQTMPRNHFMQQWFTLSRLAIEEAMQDVLLLLMLASRGKKAACSMKRPSVDPLMVEHKLADQTTALVNAPLSGKGLLLNAGTVVNGTLKVAVSSSQKHGRPSRFEMN